MLPIPAVQVLYVSFAGELKAVGTWFCVMHQFTIGLVHAFHSDEQGGSIAKIIHHLYSQYILGQLRLESGNTVLELAPEFIFVIQLVIELYLNIDNAIAAHGESLIFLHFFSGQLSGYHPALAGIPPGQGGERRASSIAASHRWSFWWTC